MFNVQNAINSYKALYLMVSSEVCISKDPVKHTAWLIYLEQTANPQSLLLGHSKVSTVCLHTVAAD